MAFAFDPTVPGNWELTHNSFREVTTAPNAERGYIPIRPTDLPEIFTSPVIAVSAGNTQSRGTWLLGCNLYQQVDITGLTEFQGQQIFVPINRPPTIFTMPIAVPQYQLYLEVPYWHLQLSLSIWQYTGPI